MDAKEFKQARLAMGLSTRQLAERFNIAKRTIERIEHGDGCSTVMALAMERLLDMRGIRAEFENFALRHGA